AGRAPPAPDVRGPRGGPRDRARPAGGWVRVPPIGLSVGDPPAGVPLVPNSGVTVFVAASRANEFAPIAQLLAAALLAERTLRGLSARPAPRGEVRLVCLSLENRSKAVATAHMQSSPRKRGPMITASGIWV